MRLKIHIFHFILILFNSFNFLIENYELTPIISIVLSFIYLIYYLSNPLITIVNLYILLFYREAIYHFQDIQISYHDSFLDDHLISKVIIILNIFHFFFLAKIPSDFSYKVFEVKKNHYTGFILLILAITLMLNGIQGSSYIITLNPFSATKKGFYEYIPGVLFLAWLYLPKKNQIWFWATGVFYCFYSLFFFARIEIIQMIFVFGIITQNLQQKRSISKMIFILSAVFLINSTYDFFRNDPSKLIALNDLNILAFENKNSLRMTHHGDVLQASARILGLIELDKINLENRFYSFPKFLLNSIGMYRRDTTVHLSQHLKRVFTSGGGALIPIYFYSWSGLIGVSLIGIFSGSLINRFYNSNNNIIKIYSTIFVISILRVLGYTPINMVRYMLYITLLFVIANTFNRYATNKRK